MNDLSTTLAVAQTVSITEAEGPGSRYALWFQGCPLRCPGCCNPEFLPFSGGTPRTVAEILVEIDRAALAGIEGVSLLGGEPFAHRTGAKILAEEIRNRGLSVMIYSGYTIEAIRKLDGDALRLLELTDLLVDGPFVRECPDTARRWIGSTNQRIHFLTDRYREDDPCWKRRNTLEIRLDSEGLSVNGFPALQAIGLWKRLPQQSARSRRDTAETADAGGINE